VKTELEVETNASDKPDLDHSGEASKPPRDGRSLPRVRSVARAIAILRSFSSDKPFLTLGEIAERTGLDAGTTRRLLITLRDEGLVWQKYQKGLYCLSYRVLELTQSIPGRITLNDLLGANLLQLAKDSGMTVYLSIASGNEAICLARFLSEQAIDIRWWSEGYGLPLHCGAGPKILLAHFTAQRRHNLYQDGLKELTPKSIVDPDLIEKEIISIIKTGYAVGVDDVALGLSALGMPIYNENGELLAAVSIAGLTPYFTGDEQVRLHHILQQAVSEMTHHVGKIKPPISTGEIYF
jgi:IclR family acetate operon transcriptional repressor